MIATPILKSLVQRVPWPLGRALAGIPYQYRFGLGSCYSKHAVDIGCFDKLSIREQQDYIFSRVRNSLSLASSVPFYDDLYKRLGIQTGDIKSFDDLALLPVISKEMLREWEIDRRSRICKGRYVANTGGTSGSPLNFYVTPRLIPNEWAHMHKIWSKIDFRQDKLKLVFGGRNLGAKPIHYDGLRHSYLVNIYMEYEKIADQLKSVIRNRNIEYLHGYPSAIAEFGRNLSSKSPDVLQELRKNLRGVFLGSEYPYSIYRNEIEETFLVPTVSWYGHTERAILAWEKEESFVYHTFQTYGFCEAVKSSEAGVWRLVGTSYYNDASPFIRYDTGDEVEPVAFRDGILRSFKITTGRIGDYVLDRTGARISLTALIFGRHHALFDIVRHIQVRQEKAGHIEILITPKQGFPADFNFNQWFDQRSLAMTVDYQIVQTPFLSESGKVALLVK